MSSGKKRRLNAALTILTALTVAFIWGNSMLDRAGSAQLSNGLLEFLRPFLGVFGIEAVDDHWLRKLAHFCEFGLLGVELGLLSFLNGKHSCKAFALCALFSLLVAAADESIQLISGRHGHILDVALDLSGALCGISGMLILGFLYEKHKSRKT